MRTNFNNQAKSITLIIAIIIAMFSTASFAFSPEKDLTNQQTFALQNEEKLILIDVRTPDEWKKIGVAKGAITLSMLDQQFLVELNEIRAKNPEKIIAFICASGNRSEVVRAELARRGYENIYSVYGGTTGNGVTGWIKEGLPMEKYQ